MVSARSSRAVLGAVRRSRAARARPLSWILLAAFCAASAGCATAPPAETAATAAAATAPAAVPEVDRPSGFQMAMKLHGIPLDVPQKGKAILVNIPSYELIAFEDGEPVLRSRVIVGRDAFGDRTPELDTETSVVRFRPTWRPTPMMVRSGKYEDRTWPPGRNNPLGLLAIRLEPGMLIYLHGTNNPKLFKRDERALSSGCIRVERWDEVAAWVLGTNVDEVHRAANGGRTFDMETEGVPVMIRYFTEFPDATGALQAHDDVYGRGAATATASAASPVAAPPT